MPSTVWNIIWTWHVRCNLGQTQTTHTQKNVLYLLSQQASSDANSYSFPPTPFHVKAISEQGISILHWGWRHFLPAAAHQWQPQGWLWSHLYFLRFLSEGILETRILVVKNGVLVVFLFWNHEKLIAPELEPKRPVWGFTFCKKPAA